MISNDLKQLELFIDNFAVSSKKTPTNSWMNPCQYEISNGVPYVQGYSNISHSKQNTGDLNLIQPLKQPCSETEFWQENSIKNDWHVGTQEKILQGNGYKRDIQDASSCSKMFFNNLLEESLQRVSETSLTPNGSNEIQNLVCDLIRQNNMKNPYNLPPWVDVTKPPPPLPKCISLPPIHYRSSMQNSNNYSQESSVPNSTQNFQQRFNPTTNIANISNMSLPPRQDEVPNGLSVNLNSRMHLAMQRNIQKIQQEAFLNTSLPKPVEHDRKQTQSEGDFLKTSLSNINDFECVKQNPVTGTEESSALLKNLKSKLHSTILSNPSRTKWAPSTDAASTKASEGIPFLQNSKSSNIIQADFKPKSNIFDQYSAQDCNTTAHHQKDQINRRHSFVGIQNKMKAEPFCRQLSAADLDQNWRNHDTLTNPINASLSGCGDGKGISVTNSGDSKQMSSSKKQPQSLSFNASGDCQPESTDRKSVIAEPPTEYKKISESENNGHRHVTEKSKVKLISLLRQSNEISAESSVGKKIRHLQISSSENDFNKFIKDTQNFATNESKMREVAEVLCNKALSDEIYARNIAILCDRMSFLMVQGTKFRSVVLNVMQGHYKNREQLFSASLRNDKRWFGFVTFLVEVFLNVQTSTNERLIVLSNPVYNCLVQVLHSDRINKEHIECFSRLFQLVGPAFQSDCPSKLDKLVSEVRDRCVMSKNPFVKRVLLHCVEIYASSLTTVTTALKM